MIESKLDPVRGAEAARKLRGYGVKGVLINAAELGYITEVKCGMRECYCPEEVGGRMSGSSWKFGGGPCLTIRR